MLTNDLSATYNDFISFDDSLITGANSGLKMELLWENTSIDSEFEAQTITIESLEKYNYLWIVAKSLRGRKEVYNNLILNVYHRWQILYSPYWNDGQGSVVTTRGIVINGNEITFETGKTFSAIPGGKDASGSDDMPGYCIPWLIYGVK